MRVARNREKLAAEIGNVADLTFRRALDALTVNLPPDYDGNPEIGRRFERAGCWSKRLESLSRLWSKVRIPIQGAPDPDTMSLPPFIDIG
jgi:hypothetical protein